MSSPSAAMIGRDEPISWYSPREEDNDILLKFKLGVGKRLNEIKPWLEN